MAKRPEYDPLSDDLSVERRVAQLVMPILDLRGPSPQNPGHTPEAGFEQAEKWLDDLGVGGFLLFGGDDKTRSRLDALKRPGRGPADIGPLIAADLERGLGQQVQGGTDLPPVMALGAARDEGLARAAGALTGREARAVGIDWVFAPVLDLADLAENPIVQARAFGSEPDLVARLGIAWAQGLEEEGVLSCVKHFPGHGGTARDSHDSLPRVTRTREVLEARDLAPFRAAAAVPLASFMTAHVAYPGYFGDKGDGSSRGPATTETALVTGILRQAFKYDGLVVTDALIMTGVTQLLGGDEGKAAVLALEAGADVLLYPKDPRAVVRTVAAWVRTGGQPARLRLQDAVGRVLHAKRQLGLAGPAHATKRKRAAVAPDPEGPRLAQRIADAAVTHAGAARPPLEKATAGRAQDVFVLVLDDDAVPHPALDLVLELQEKLGSVRTATLVADPKDAASAAPKSEGLEAERARVTALLASADRIVVAVLCKTRAWKGRAGLHPNLAAVLAGLPGERTTVVGLATPYALAKSCPRGSQVLLAYGDDPFAQRAAAKVLLGAAAPGTLPVPGLDLFRA